MRRPHPIAARLCYRVLSVSTNAPASPLSVPRMVAELLRLSGGRRTGVLEVRAEGLVTIVHFDAGTPVFAEEGSLGETLGRVLVRQGKLTQAQYLAVIQRMTQSVMQSEQLRFGEVAVALGFISTEAVSEGLHEQVRAKVARCLQWQEPELGFREDAEEVADVTHFPCPVPQVLWYGVRRLWDPLRCRAIWGATADHYPVIVGDRVTMIQELALGPSEQGWLRLIDGTRTADHLVQSSPLDIVLTTQLLTVLLLLGWVELEVEALPPPSRIAPAPVIVTPPHEPVPSPNVVGSRASRPRSSRPQQQQLRLAAEQEFEAGKRHLFADEPAEALPHFLEAVRLFPVAAEYLVYAEWTRFLLLESPGDKLLKRRELHGTAVRALRQDATIAMAHYVLAELAALDRNDEGIRHALQLALRSDPRHPLVQRFARARGHQGGSSA
jgi:hypothetical protein